MKAHDLVGKTVVLTGKFSDLDRAEAEAALARLGATIGSGVTRATHVLFVGERAGSKLARARALGIEVRDEAALKELLSAAPAAAPTAAPASAPASAPVACPGLSGKTVVLTGTFTLMKRADAARLLAEAGATVGTSVGNSTDLLIHGDDAGAKLEAARSRGVARMTEAEMVALLSAAGIGGELLAAAGDRLARKAAEDAAHATEMTRVAAELRAFLERLRGRPDITVTVAELGRKAGKAKLDQLRALRVPQDLVDLYAEIDGIHIEWRFVEPPGEGCIRVPAVTQWTRFGTDDQHYMNFGDDREAMLLDEITPEGNTWLVRSRKAPRGSGPREASIVFASAAEGADGIVAAPSLPEYFRAAMASGFVPYWPRCFKPNRYVSYATQEAAVERFRAAPVAPTPIGAGTRVEFAYFAEGGRGEALALHTVAASRHAAFTGREFVRVRLDEGTVAWLPQKWTKALTGRDAYERLREPAEPLVGAELSLRFDELARAIGPLAHFAGGSIGMLPSNARRATGLLATRPFADALRQVLDLRDAAVRARLELKASRPLAPTGDEFGPAELSRFGWRYDLSGVLTGLLGGLQILAHHESARRRVPGRELVPSALRERLVDIDAAAELRERLDSAEILAAPKWDHVGSDPAELGLPSGEPVLSGAGF
ncbi:BRCA1 C Terminus (BRCT) domain-containing protein [Nannocystis exedens]|uniref:BRCA1 C Terminus (BRCT) domain-containing protein n=1 Tax=Nannocystis exedens TaxID=54 RepID=A0A1I2GME2_9BACT|nr:BRCT domain-containing protein [Nannocystis exedens]PCC73625.1 DNA ligase [Nannocystis exedens]SFF18017.1 BRCA1 C Terminus (BRCT) domain-containing protein [Nannocystis exedens]